MLNFLNDVKEKIGMDANYFYPALITLLTILISFLSSIFKNVKNRMENNLCEIQTKSESDSFFGFVMIMELILSGIVFFIIIVMQVLINLCKLSSYSNIIILFLLIILTIISIRFVLGRIFVRKRIIGRNNAKWLLCAPIIIYNFFVYQFFYGMRNDILECILFLFFLGVEIWGLCVFRGRYIQYKYASADLYLSEGNVIKCEDISKIRRRFNALIIDDEEKQIRINYNNILRVEYYGGVKIEFITKNNRDKSRNIESKSVT